MFLPGSPATGGAVGIARRDVIFSEAQKRGLQLHGITRSARLKQCVQPNEKSDFNGREKLAEGINTQKTR